MRECKWESERGRERRERERAREKDRVRVCERESASGRVCMFVCTSCLGELKIDRENEEMRL